MSSIAFTSLAKDAMSSGDAALLDYCSLDPDPAKGGEDGPAYKELPKRTTSELINRWREWERTLRLGLAKNRAIKLKRDKDGDKYGDAPEYPGDASAAAKAAMSLESPMEAELFLDKARWDAIESFQGINTFSEDAMYAYLLKLLILERRAAFVTEEGFSEYKALYTAILGEAK